MDAIGRPRAGARVLSKVEADEVNTKTRQAFLAIGMLVSGTANTLTCKATMSVVSDGGSFEHPFLMASCMFSGEILCLVLYEASRVMSRKPAVKAVPKHIFALPAACDIIGTSIMYIGLTMTSASVYQMLRGSVIMFTGALSALYLRRRIRGYQWLAMSLVFSGVLIVGSASMMQASSTDSAATASSEHATTQAMVGSALVVASQVFTALQMVAEEKFVTGYNAPALMAVGWEGVWGLVGITALLCGLQNTPGQPVEDSLWAFEQIRQQPRLIMLMLANALSIAFFNYFGMSITKSSSASYRTVLDSLRTLAVWLIDVCIGGKPVHPLQLIGFAFMFSGTVLFNETVRVPWCCVYPTEAERQEEREAQAAKHARAQPLLGDEASERPAARPVQPLGVSFAPNGSASPPPPRIDDMFTPTLSRFTMTRHS